MDGYGFIILAFRGTSDYDQQMFEQGWNYTEMVPFSAGGKVGKYFFDTFNNVWNKGGMKDDVYTLKNKYPTYRFHVVGHSLGGAVASIAAATIVSNGIAPANRTHLYTFGEPRSGDKDYANAFISLQINSIRIVHNRDAIPHLPSLNDTVYYHHVREIWYPTDEMSDIEPYFECSSIDGEDPKCANSLSGTLNFDDHKKYFGRDFSYYGINGCNDL
uniref:Fungal lipase-like domain-containing protein n=1 Tax=Panagrolaimus davidi TaxID=227884 RepID=A0A914QJ80_9BILA